MFIGKIAKVIYTPNTAEEDMRITVKTMNEGKVLWQGKAKDLKAQTQLANWMLVEMLIDKSDRINHTVDTPEYNLGKILIVI